MRKVFAVLIIASLLGLLASVLMTRLHYRIGRVGFEEKSFCHVSELFDCDTALASRFSHLNTKFGVVLTSELGVLYYLLVFCGLLYAWFSPNRRSILAFFLGSSLFALTYSLAMAYLSFFKLGVICLLCLTTYLCNFFLVLLLPPAMEIGFRDVRKFFQFLKQGLVLHLVAALLLVAVGLVFFRGLNPEIHKARAQIPRELYLQAFYSLPQKEIALPERPFWGNPKGKVTLVVFSDFQCPFCRFAAFSLKPYLKEFQDRVRLVYMNFPLDNSCNPAILQTMHPTSCLAAKAALCAHSQGKFWEYHDKIFENQKRLSWATLIRLAGEEGMDPSQFEKCMVSDEIADRVKEDVELGNRLEIHGTPSVYINGRFFGDWSQPERLRMVVESELSKGN